MKKYIERHRVGRGFVYFLDDKQITDKNDLAYLKSFRVPPAWTDVKISVNKNARILATGYDQAGRMQYIYHPKFRARQDQAKFERILRFARALPKMRQVTAEHLRHQKLDQPKVLATIVQLMDQAYFRVGNDVYARENQSYGLTTLRSKHTKVRGDTIMFDFIGKSGQKQIKRITNRRLAKVIKQLDDLPGYEVFKYYGGNGELHHVDSADVNEYIKEIMGEEFSAKDFRTWGGTLLAAAELADAERVESERERKKIVTQCVKRVASKLGNTPAIARASYIDPRVINSFINGNELHEMRATVEKIEDTGELSYDEHCVLNLLEKAKA